MAHNSISSLRTRNASRLSLAALTLFASLSAQAQQAGPSQNVYLGVGALSIATIGYARPINSNFGLRAEYGGWTTLSRDFTLDDSDGNVSAKFNHAGVFADWFPFENGFRLVGGVSLNDYGVTFSANPNINLEFASGKTINLTNESFSVNLTFPKTTPYLGIGYGHQQSKDKGIGFYADVGVLVGSIELNATTSLVDKTASNGLKITQADIDDKLQSVRDEFAKYNVFPSFSLGLVYRY
jgi:hypothetical protein